MPTHAGLERHLRSTPELAKAFAAPLAVVSAARRGETDVEKLRATSRAARLRQENAR